LQLHPQQLILKQDSKSLLEGAILTPTQNLARSRFGFFSAKVDKLHNIGFFIFVIASFYLKSNSFFGSR